MSTVVFAIRPEASVWAAAAEMDRHGVKRLPVTDAEGTLVGIVSRADLIRVMAQEEHAPPLPDVAGLLSEGALRFAP